MLKHAVIALVLILAAVHAPDVSAVAVDKPLADPAQEARARELHKQLRCLVCQNQSIEDSNAELARDLRQLVRERIAAGDSDEATVAFVVARYGDWVLLQPPLKTATILLWSAPGLLLLAGLLVAAVWFRRRRSGAAAVQTPTPLSDEERRRLDEIMTQDPPE
jgi:cytochrome c-type biogenesis protein CcmH